MSEEPKPEWLAGLEPLGVLSIKPGDQVVLMCPIALTQEQKAHVEEYFSKRLDTPVLVLDQGLQIGVIHKEPEG